MKDLKIAGKIESFIDKQIKLGLKKDLIVKKTIQEFVDEDPSIVRTLALSYIEKNVNYKTVQKITRSKILTSLSKGSKSVMYDPVTHSRTVFDPSNLRIALSTSYDTSKLINLCNFDYNPHKPAVIYEGDDGYLTYNQYIPPKWLENWFYSGGALQIEPYHEVPELIEKFLQHLVKGDDTSYEYLLDWIAYGIHNKNFCFLVTIGRQGVGKGRLGDIMKCIYGDQNYYVGGDKMFNGTFNSQIADKKLVYCDEALLKKRSAQNRLKEVANFTIEKEAKGIDAENVKNYANFYISSNDIDGLPVTEDDRRFSLIELTDVKLPHAMTFEEIQELDSNPELIDKFARFLYYREVDREKMLYPVKTVKRKEIIELTKHEWEKIFLYKLCYRYRGKFVELREVKADLKMEGSSMTPGQPAFEKLCRKVSGVFEVRQPRKSDKVDVEGKPFGIYVFDEFDKDAETK